MAQFLKANGIAAANVYDAMHANTLVPDTVLVISLDPVQVLQLR